MSKKLSHKCRFANTSNIDKYIKQKQINIVIKQRHYIDVLA